MIYDEYATKQTTTKPIFIRAFEYLHSQKINTGFTLQKKNFFVFLILLMMLNFVMQGLYDIQITTNKFSIARMNRACVVFLYLKKPSQTEIGKLLKKLVETPFSFLHYKIALKLKLLLKKMLVL
jgi:hypothetical protein